MIVALWLLSELLPLIPAFDWQAIKGTNRGLAHGEFSFAATVLHAAGLVLAGEASSRLMSRERALFGLVTLTALVALGNVVVARPLNVSVLAGLAAGWSAWLILRTRSDLQRSPLIVLTLIAAYALAALAPFDLADSPNAFSWLPFGNSPRGPMLEGETTLATSALLFTGVVWLVRDAGGSARGASIGLALVALILGLAQIFLHGRSPGVTEPVLAVFIGLVVHAWPGGGRKREPTMVAAPDRRFRAEVTRVLWSRGSTGWTIRALLACGAIAAAITAVLRMPGIPYNVAELFHADGAFPILLVFALALLWTGAGPALIADWIKGDPRRDWLLPLLAFGAGLVSLLLLWFSVTEESISDIAGSNNLYRLVTKENLWGGAMREAFLLLAPGLVGFVERCVRYAALYGPFVAIPSVMFLVLDTRNAGTLSTERLMIWLAGCAGWLWLCKAIVFDWASTDNLDELVARSGFFGLGGGGYLYLLVSLMSANIVGLARAPARLSSMAAGLVVTGLLAPVGWWLVTHGLEPRVEKYGSVFSGTQFLLGPDRKHLLSEEVLFLRWTVVQLCGIALAVAGARLALTRPRRGGPAPGD
jgi:hypothetical protein